MTGLPDFCSFFRTYILEKRTILKEKYYFCNWNNTITMTEPSCPTLYNPQTGEQLNTKTIKLVKDVEDGKEKTIAFDNVDDLMKDLLS
jgi:hypothetical protein